ncbi:hypothetical protein GCM10010495_25030 [Kitasatospora herbaricolor]|nr:hypothetical protein GCM10010495_25030 [Kitasatospora herbaricolor]
MRDDGAAYAPVPTPATILSRPPAGPPPQRTGTPPGRLRAAVTREP